ncbi:MAG: TldD/PmbA family protein [Planctomycetes bacterium]|nr:TldD/PmbA family protein [Planctomycetota bacterium]
MAETDRYYQLAEKALDLARSLGAQWCDVSVGSGRHIGVALEKTAIKEADSGQSQACSVRVFVDGAMGYATSGGHEEDRLLAAARRAVGMAREGSDDPDFVSLPAPESADEIDGLYDPAIDAMTVSDVVALAVANIKLAREMERDVNLSGQISLTSSEGVLVSSTGIRLDRRRTELDGDVEAIISRGDAAADKGYYYDFDSGRMLSDCNVGEIARAAVEGARQMLGARRIGSGRMPILLGPVAAYDFLGGIIAAANAESLQRGRSYLCGKMGQTLGSEHLTLTDDGLIPRGLYSGAYDGEGAPRRRVTIFDRGVFSAQLHNSYTAAKAGEPNTGHGVRSGGVHPTNMVVGLGTRTAAELIAEVDRGLYLPIGHFSPNPASGDLSSSVDFGLLIEGGRVVHPVENVMVAGNMIDLMKAVDAVSSDYREEPGNLLPTIRIRDVQVAGTE